MCSIIAMDKDVQILTDYQTYITMGFQPSPLL
jgi:hypothetical protein